MSLEFKRAGLRIFEESIARILECSNTRIIECSNNRKKNRPAKKTERSIAMQKKLRRDVSTEQKNKDETNCLTGFPLIAFQGTQKGYSLNADFK